MQLRHLQTLIPYAILGTGVIFVATFLRPPVTIGPKSFAAVSSARSFLGSKPGWPEAIAAADAGSSEKAKTATLSPPAEASQLCSAWLQDWADPVQHEAQLEWILGFITGSNYRTEGQGQPGSSDEVEIFIEHYCRNNPEAQLFMAAAALVQETGGPIAFHAFKKSADGASNN
jgi:hypothetical protein